jgi:hypothetical protein
MLPFLRLEHMSQTPAHTTHLFFFLSVFFPLLTKKKYTLLP